MTKVIPETEAELAAELLRIVRQYEKTHPADHKPRRVAQPKPLSNDTLTVFFSQVTGIPVPLLQTERNRRSASALWWEPLRQIVEGAGSREAAEKVIRLAVQNMRHGRLTIASPSSILKVALSEIGKINTTQPKYDPEHTPREW